MNDLVEEFERYGIHLWSEGGQLRYRAPLGALTEERKQILVSNKEALISYLDADNVRIVPDPEQRYEPYPLTPMQSAYQLGRHHAFDFGGVPCTTYMEISYEGDVSVDVERAWNEVIGRHDSLRSVISDEGYQRVLESVEPYVVSTVDARGLGQEEVESLVTSVREQMTSASRDASMWPLFEIKATVSDRETILHFFIELVVVDAASVQILLGEIDKALAESLGEPPSVTFRDYVIAERALRSSPRFHRDWSYWMGRLDELPPAPDLPTIGCGSEGSGSGGFYRLSRSLTQWSWEGLAGRSKKHGMTVSVAVLAAYAEAVGRWSCRRQFTLNIPVFNRIPLHEEIGGTVGDFTSVSLLGIDLDAAGTSFTERASAIGGQLYDDLEHRLFTGLDVIAELGRRQGKSPLFPVVFTSTIDSASNLGGSKGSFRRGLTQTPQVWIDCQIMANGEGGLLTWDVRENVLPDGMAEAAFESFADLVERLSSDDETWSEALPLRLPVSQLLQRALANDTSAPLPNYLLHEPVLEQSSLHPDRPAVADCRGVSMYREIVSRANAAAHALRLSGCRQGERIAICMEKGADQVAAVLGVGLAGAVYVPVDPSQPVSRRNRILADAGIRLVLTQSWVGRGLDMPAEAIVLNVDELPDAPEEFQPDCETSPDDPAYVIYTSGSTGVPKGVEVSHRAAANTIQDINSRFRIGKDDRVLSIVNLGFDLSVYDFFGILSVGGMVALPDPSHWNDPSHWGDLVAEHGITLWNSVPSQMQMLQDYADAAGNAANLASLRFVMLSGDWIPLKLPPRIKKHIPGAEVVSLGGATEASIWSIFHSIEGVHPEWTSIPYGKPLANQHFRILDEALQDRPDMVPGELYIGGAGLANGYLGDARKTQESFIVHPLDGERLYRTGDFGKYWSDGTIEFLGREDSQVKIRGHRIELGEVEAALCSHGAISDAAVLVFEESEADGLVGFAQLSRSQSAPDAEDGVKDAAIRECEDIESQIDPDKFRELMLAMDKIAVRAMVSQLREVGLFPSPDVGATREQIMKVTGADASRERLLRRWLDALEDAGALVLDVEEAAYYCRLESMDLAEDWERIRALGDEQAYGSDLLDFMQVCLSCLGELLRGESDVRDVLFPEGEFGAARAVYTDNIVGRAVNSIAASAIRQIAEEFYDRHPSNPFKIIEVGAGIAGTTMDIVEAIKDFSPDYLFTDISDFFLSEARKTFERHPWMSYGIFDINSEIGKQGYSPNSVNAILCANVLHNSRDASSVLDSLRELLAPGGWLVFIEPIRRHNYSQLVSMEFEFTREDFADERAQTGQSFFTKDQWVSLLNEAGADTIYCIPEQSSTLFLAGQGVFLVRFKTSTAFTTYDDVRCHMEKRLPGYMVPKVLQLVDALPQTKNGKIDRAALSSQCPRKGSRVHAETLSSGSTFVDELEVRLASIWSELLGAPEVGRDQDFYSLGGDSLLLSRMVGKIREDVPEAANCEWAVLLRQMLQEPTIKGLADFLRKSAVGYSPSDSSKGSSRVLLLGSGSIEPACVLTHAGTGTLQPYQALVPKLRSKGKHDLVGIEIGDLEEYLSLSPEVAISALASNYARDLMEKYDSFVIAGYCIGGFLAAEVSRLLLETGADVARLVAISSMQPPVVNDELMVEYLYARSMGADMPQLGLPADSDEFAQAIRHILSESPGIIPSESLVGLNGEYEEYGSAFRRFAGSDHNGRIDVIHHASSASGVYNTGSYSEEEFARLFKVFRQSLLAVAHHQPEPYIGPTVLLRNMGSSSLLPGTHADVAGCWEQICVGDFEVRDLPGDHFRCMASANASLISDVIEDVSE